MTASVKNAPVSRSSGGSRGFVSATFHGRFQICVVAAAFLFVATMILAL